MRPLAVLILVAGLAAAERPRLVVVVAVDQLRPDAFVRFGDEFTGGLERLLNGGRHFRGALDHGGTETGPGHSTMLTGCRPATTGIVANNWLDRSTMKSVYCVEDAAHPVYGLEGEGRSPVRMLRDALGDWMKRAEPRTKVYSVSAKDRAAICMGGRRPDGAYWMERKAGGFTTSRYYHADGLPEWLKAFNADGWLESLPAHWTYEPVDALRQDDDPRESSRYGRASPHPIQGGTRQQVLDRVYRSPYMDEWTLRLAASIVERFDLGGDEACDLLCVSLSANDSAGHLYGPFSQEIRDLTLRLDRRLGEFFDLLDRRGAPYVVVLTADHGVLPIPEMRRTDARAALQAIAIALQKEFGTADLYRFAGSEIYLDRKRAAERELDPERVLRVLAEVLRAQDYVEAVFDADARAKEPEPGLCLLDRRSYHPERSGDLTVVLKPNHYLDFYGGGTGHGSPWPYDREVPVVFLGPECEPGRVDLPARTIDIAPTLARLLGIAAPSDLDGEPLPLR